MRGKWFMCPIENWLLLPKGGVASLWEWVQKGGGRVLKQSPVIDEYVRIKCERCHTFLKEAMASRKPLSVNEK